MPRLELMPPVLPALVTLLTCDWCHSVLVLWVFKLQSYNRMTRGSSSLVVFSVVELKGVGIFNINFLTFYTDSPGGVSVIPGG